MLVIDLERGEHRCFAPLPTVPHSFSVRPPCAIGSGMDFALAAMACGKTAAEAVEIAARFDPNTGGRVDVIDCQEIATLPGLRVTNCHIVNTKADFYPDRLFNQRPES
jgi:hypothetical protein